MVGPRQEPSSGGLSASPVAREETETEVRLADAARLEGASPLGMVCEFAAMLGPDPVSRTVSVG